MVLLLPISGLENLLKNITHDLLLQFFFIFRFHFSIIKYMAKTFDFIT